MRRDHLRLAGGDAARGGVHPLVVGEQELLRAGVVAVGAREDDGKLQPVEQVVRRSRCMVGCLY